MVVSGFNISSLLASVTENDEDGEDSDYESRLNLSVTIYLDGFPASFSRATCTGVDRHRPSVRTVRAVVRFCRQERPMVIDCAPCPAFFKSAILLVRMADVIFLYLFHVLS